MLRFKNISEPESIQDLVANTRENERNLSDYQTVLSNFALTPIAGADSAKILEIGTGKGNALKGLWELTNAKGLVASCDIDEAQLRKIEALINSGSLGLPFKARCELFCIGKDDNRTFLTEIFNLFSGDLSNIEYRVLPERYFDFAISIWVFYQIGNKIRVLGHVLNSLKASGSFVFTSAGHVAIIKKELSHDQIDRIKHFVWNHKAQRFGWLTGQKEIEFVFDEIGNEIEVLSFGKLVERMLPEVLIEIGLDYDSLPPGHARITLPSVISQGLSKKIDQMMAITPSFYVTTRFSAVIPIYLASPLLYGTLEF